MNWIKIKNRDHPRFELPLLKTFFAIFDNQLCIAEFSQHYNTFAICYLPSRHPNMEHRFSHYIIPTYPEDMDELDKD